MDVSAILDSRREGSQLTLEKVAERHESEQDGVELPQHSALLGRSIGDVPQGAEPRGLGRFSVLSRDVFLGLLALDSHAEPSGWMGGKRKGARSGSRKTVGTAGRRAGARRLKGVCSD